MPPNHYTAVSLLGVETCSIKRTDKRHIVAQTMIHLSYAPALVILLCCTIFSEPVAARRSDPSLRSLDNKLRLEAKKRWESSPRRRSGAGNTRRAADTSASPGVKNITFTNPLASSAYTRVHALSIRLSVSCAFRVLRGWYKNTLSGL